MTDTAVAAPDDLDIPTRPRTIAELPFFASGRYPKPDLIGQCREGGVDYTSGRDLLPKVRDISLGLSALGMKPGHRVAILSESRPEWLFADLAVLAGGGVTTPVYPTLSADQIAFILADCEASIVVVSTSVQLEKLLSIIERAPSVETVVMMGDVTMTSDRVRIERLETVATMGHDRLRAGWGVAREFHEAARRVRPDDLATIIYTSGTTAEPKGVMLTHANLVANLDGVLQVLDLREEDVALSFLPLCHGFERMVAYIYLTVGISVAFAESIDTIARDLQVVRPTVMSGVPRVFEKLRARIFEKASQAPAPRRALFHWAVSVAERRGRLLGDRKPLPASLRLASAVADRLVFAKIRAGVGGRMRFAVSGSAPLDPGLATFFYGVGLPILEGYGLTETAPVLCVMPLEHVRFGTVGPPLPNVELKIATDGEILARGPNVMLGYYRRPEDTAAVMTDGWFHTGDIGALDEAGFLRITDRKKEVIVTSGGKKVAPQPIEQRLRQQPFVAEAVLVGDRRHFPAALLLPDFAALAARWGVTVADARARVSTPETHALLQAAFDAANEGLAQFERVKKFVPFTEELTIANGMLTPTLKVKRRVFEERYREEIDGMYEEGLKA
jgi:long-chain acyl-CoA synthetase